MVLLPPLPLGSLAEGETGCCVGRGHTQPRGEEPPCHLEADPLVPGSAFPTSSLKGGLAFYQMSDMCWKLPVSMVTGNFTSLSDSLGVDIRVSPHFQVHGIAHT
uniref:Uncharacterized protein n=1 Tax=Mustela putorius furo TaxID=9669 RepID=M3XVG0_MUSPF